MAESAMIPLGTQAPFFSLTDSVSGATISLDDFAEDQALLVVFLANHCPYVQHVIDGLAQLGHDYSAASVGIVAIAASDVSVYPQDGPDAMKVEAERLGWEFPYLFDEAQDVAAAYTAMCTPDWFLFGPDRALVYRGRLDDSRPNSGTPVTGEDLRAAIDAVLADDAPSTVQHPSMGCSIKWKEGNVPVYLANV